MPNFFLHPVFRQESDTLQSLAKDIAAHQLNSKRSSDRCRDVILLTTQLQQHHLQHRRLQIHRRHTRHQKLVWTTSLLLLRFHQLCPQVYLLVRLAQSWPPVLGHHPCWFMVLDSAVHPQWPNLHLLLTACNDLLKTHENIQYSLWSLSILEFVIDFSLSYWITDCVCERVFRTRVADMSLQTLKYDLKNSVNRFRIQSEY